MSKDPFSPNKRALTPVEEMIEEAKVARDQNDREDASRLSKFFDLPSLKRQSYESIVWRNKEAEFFRISGSSIRASRILSVPASIPWLLMFSEISRWEDSYKVVFFGFLLAYLWFPNWFSENVRNFSVDTFQQRYFRDPLPPQVHLVIGWLVLLIPSGILLFRALAA